MKAASVAASVFLIAQSAIFAPSFASTDCEKSGLTAEQVENCLSEARQQKPKAIRKPTVFPVRFHGITRESISSNPVERDWYSTDGTKLEISTPRICGALGCAAVGKDLKKIPTERIVEYQMSIAGTGNNAAEQVQSVAITALIVPILAPFAAAINSKSHEIYHWSITYIDEEGFDKTETLTTSSTIPVADRYYTFLPTLIGMKPGEKRSPELLAGFYEQGAEELSVRLKKLETLLTKEDPKKPWCYVVVADRYPLVFDKYEETREKLNAVNKKLSRQPVASLTSASSEKKWQEYLNTRLNLKAWAGANPVAAEKLRSCVD